jgi:hypothetical protein
VKRGSVEERLWGDVRLGWCVCVCLNLVVDCEGCMWGEGRSGSSGWLFGGWLGVWSKG